MRYHRIMQLHELADTWQRLAATSSRLDKIGLLADLLRKAEPDDIAIVTRFLSGSLSQGRIGVGPALITSSRSSSFPPRPSVQVREVDETFERISQLSGKGAQNQKRALLRDLFARATDAEQEFLTHLLFGELRQGAAPGLMAEAIARASGVDAKAVRRAIMTSGELGEVALTALTQGKGALDQVAASLFQPIQPMLAQSAADAEEAVDLLGDALLEWKMDGARIQVHKSGDEVRVYSRQLHEVTSSVPEVVEAALALPARSLILDGEVIALRPDRTPHPFQLTMRRFGSKDSAEGRSQLPLTPFFFDLLHLDGELWIDRTQEERSRELESLAGNSLVIPHLRVTDRNVAADFLRTARAAGHEGIMAKSITAPYEAGNRGSAWLKVKPVHTLDLVVLAAEWGHGRRRGWLSNLHLGARDPRTESFIMLGKTFKGMTDAVLQWQTEQLLAREIGREGIVVHVRPELVVEIAFNDVQSSSQYPGGVALRFARVKRYRADKTADSADTIDSVWRIYRDATGEYPAGAPISQLDGGHSLAE